MLRSLWVGVLIAVPSGAGVALSILGGNTGSLVGVAISASLLPPAVNAVSHCRLIVCCVLCPRSSDQSVYAVYTSWPSLDSIVSFTTEYVRAM